MTSLKFDIAFSAASFPRLRSGVNYFAVGNEFNPCMYVGFSHRGVELESQIAKYLLHLLDGSHTLESIYQLLAGNLMEVAEILKVLDREQLIEFRTSKLVTFIEGEFAPVNLISFTNKMRAE